MPCAAATSSLPNSLRIATFRRRNARDREASTHGPQAGRDEAIGRSHTDTRGRSSAARTGRTSTADGISPSTPTRRGPSPRRSKFDRDDHRPLRPGDARERRERDRLLRRRLVPPHVPRAALEDGQRLILHFGAVDHEATRLGERFARRARTKAATRRSAPTSPTCSTATASRRSSSARSTTRRTSPSRAASRTGSSSRTRSGTPHDRHLADRLDGSRPADADRIDPWGYKRTATAADFRRQYGDLLAAVRATPVFAGFCYTQFTDTYQEANGLLYMDRTPKLPIEQIRKATSG